MTNTPSRVVVLDFDGTMTDAEAEGAPFRIGYIEDLKTLVGADTAETRARVDAIVAEAEGALRTSPERHPFMWKGRAVAPASVDPYLRMVPVADAVFDAHQAFPNPVDRGRLTGGVLYRYNYARTQGKPVFRPGAAEVLRGLAGTETFVVTNSDTEAVKDKIWRLDAMAGGGVAWLEPRVYGEARKFDVDDQWDGVAASMPVPGLDGREVLLRRRHYHARLAAILDQVGARWAELVVIGDIFELDLALPLALGARVGLVASPHTPSYERGFVTDHPRAALLADLGEVLGFVQAG